MDDILASIRRILNDGDAPPEGKPAAGPHPNPETSTGPAPLASVDEVFLLDAAMMVDDAPPAPAHTVSQAASATSSGDHLVASHTAEAASAAMGPLMQVLRGRGTEVHRGGPTIEDLVRSELRPMLASWLDAHLPGVVERLVHAEVERLTRGGV